MASKQLWRWHGITGDGNAQDGMRWAESRALLLMALQQQMVTPLSLKRIAINSAQWRGDKSAEVIHQLATLLKAGLTLSEGLALLAEQHPSKQWQALLQSLAHDLEQGIAFSNALLPWSEVFPPLYQAMIRTGELTGKLDECCFELARQQKAQRQLTDKVKSALRYPIIILAMAIMVVVAMLHFVLPEFAAIYKEAQKYVGTPYVWGGSTPETGFDCSGYVCWVYNQNGYDVGRTTANGLWNKSQHISEAEAKPGDLVFFEGTYDTPGKSHVGIYLGNGKMVSAGDPIKYADIHSSYWQKYLSGFGRLSK